VRAYEPRQRMDHGKPLVARDATATAVALQVIKELTNNDGVKSSTVIPSIGCGNVSSPNLQRLMARWSHTNA
jgi:hypothetical protein